jgi:hypothetical protein
MQVTRVLRSSQFWRDIGRHSTACGVGSLDDLADEPMSAINHKASRLPKRNELDSCWCSMPVIRLPLRRLVL